MKKTKQYEEMMDNLNKNRSMANEDMKDFNVMLNNNKDMPKMQIVTDLEVIRKYGGDKMYFAPPIVYDEIMRTVPYGKIITTDKIREYIARKIMLILRSLLQQAFLSSLLHGRVLNVRRIKFLIGVP